MKLRKLVLPVAISTVIGLGMSGQASAGAYAGSGTTFDNFNVSVAPFGNAVINEFSFTITNTAQFDNGAPAITGGSCGTSTGTACGAAPNVLAKGAANAAGGDAAGFRLDNNYTQAGPSGDGGIEYANSNSRVEDAQLITGSPSKTQSIAEAEVQTAGSASANAEISSLTSFTFNFSIVTPGKLTISFDASKYLLADIDDSTADGATARASVETRFSLQQNTGGSDFWQWKPNGTDGCITSGLSCDNVSESFSMNDSANTATTPVDADDKSYLNGLVTGAFTADTGNTLLKVGDYSLTLFVKNSVVVTRREVPEPSMLFLLGAGLVGFGYVRRKKS